MLWAKVGNADGSLTGNTPALTFTPETDLTEGIVSKGPAGQESLYVLAVGAGKLQELEAGPQPASQRCGGSGHGRLARGESALSGPGHATLLTTDPSFTQGVKGLTIGEPTKAEIHQAFAEIEKDATPRDTVLVFFAGHGVTYKRGDNTYYCYLSSDATTADMHDPEVRSRQGVSMDDLVQWMVPGPNGESGIRAQRRVLVLDTCSAGEAVANLALSRGPDQDVVKAHELFKDKTGFWVLAGSAADAVSYEAGEFGHGLLTYSLLLGMAGAGLDGDRAEVEKLFTFAKGEVESLVRGRLGAVQTPQVFAMNTTFPIGLFNETDRRQITPGEARVRILRPESFVNREKGYDDLELTKALKAMLEDQNRAFARGAPTKTWFVDAEELPGALTPAGSYSVAANGHITVTLILLDRSRKKPEVVAHLSRRRGLRA